MSYKSFVIGADGLKAININSLPEDAWTILRGGAEQGDVFKYYKTVPWLNRGVNLRADAISGMPFALMQNGEEVEDPTLPFWEDMPDLLNTIAADRTMYGSAYLFKERNLLRTLGLRRLGPGSIKPIFEEEQGLIGFKRMINNKTLLFEVDDLVYSWLPSRDQKELGPGTPPAQTALMAAEVLQNIDKLIGGFFARGALRILMVSIESATPEETQRIESWFKRVATGVKNAFRAIATSAALSVIELGHAPKDLALESLSDQKREDIATALGIPLTMLMSANAGGLGGGGVREQDTLDFLNHTIIPETRKIQADLNKQLFKPLGFELKFKPEELEIFQAQESAKADKLAILFDRKIIDKNEFRSQMGYKPVEEEKPDPPALPPGPMIIDGQAQEITPEEKALRQWEAKAKKRVKEGKHEKALEFESEAISPEHHESIVQALKTARSAKDVQGVFDRAAGDAKKSSSDKVRAMRELAFAVNYAADLLGVAP